MVGSVACQEIVRLNGEITTICSEERKTGADSPYAISSIFNTYGSDE